MHLALPLTHALRSASTAVDQPLLQAYRSARGTSCGSFVCLCCTCVDVHGRSFQSARVIVFVLPMPSVLDVFPSVEPTTIVNVCMKLAGFEQNRHFEIYRIPRIIEVNNNAQQQKQGKKKRCRLDSYSRNRGTRYAVPTPSTTKPLGQPYAHRKLVHVYIAHSFVGFVYKKIH